MDKSQIAEILSDLIDTEIRETDRLLEILQQEREQIHHNPDRLVALSEEKLARISVLEQLDQKRNAAVSGFGYSADKNGIQTLIHSCAKHSGKLQERWDLLRNKISECREQNQINGRAMDTSLRAVRQALSILYGQLEQKSGYDAAGSETNEKLSRSIAKA